MKIKVLNANKEPIANTKIQLQIKGKDGGFLSVTSNAEGIIILDDKYNGQQLTSTMGGGQPQWIQANDGNVLTVAIKTNAAATTNGGKR